VDDFAAIRYCRPVVNQTHFCAVVLW